MPTPGLVPDIDGQGLIGTTDKQWSGANFKGHINVRNQHVLLKYFVADSGTRFALTGLGADLRPTAGDIIYQYSPTGLYLVIDDTLLNSSSGYRQIGQLATELFANPVFYGTVNLASGTTGAVLYLDSGKNITYSSISSSDLQSLSGITGNIQTQLNGFSGYASLNSPIFISGITTPQIIVTGQTVSTVPYFNSTGRLVSSNVTIVDFNYVSGATGNIQGQINSLRSGGISNWGVKTIGTGTGTNAYISGNVLTSGLGIITVTISGQTLLFSGTATNTGSFVTTGQTGVFVTTGQTGAFAPAAGTGSFITTGQTGVFLQTGRFFLACDMRAAATTGDIAPQQSWSGVTLNTISYSGANFTLSGTNNIIVGGNAVGVWKVWATIPFINGGTCQSRLRRTNNTAATLVNGQATFVNSIFNFANNQLLGVITLSSGDILQLQAWVDSTGVSAYIGYSDTASSESGVYSMITFEKF